MAGTNAVFSEDVEKCADATLLADVTLDEINEQAISDTNDVAPTKGTAPDAYSVDEDLEWSECSEDDDDDNTVLTDAEYQLIVDKASAKFNRYMERLLASTSTLVFADVDSDDDEVYA
jgi:hypothetical protein